MTTTVDLVTCMTYPEITESDALLADALTARGFTVRARPWNDPRADETPAADIVVIRSSWDFHTDVEAYERWLVTSAASSVLVNPLELVRWNLRKDYLIALAAHDLPIPRTATIGAGRTDLPDWADGRTPVVVKPLVGASGVGVERIEAADLREALGVRARRAEAQIVQEFITDTDGGEWALVFLGGAYSHAFQRVPAAGEFRVNSGYGGRVRPGIPSRDLVDLGERLLTLLPAAPIYARIDLVVSSDGPTIMEVEVNEPSLCLHLDPAAAGRFADAVTAIG